MTCNTNTTNKGKGGWEGGLCLLHLPPTFTHKWDASSSAVPNLEIIGPLKRSIAKVYFFARSFRPLESMALPVKGKGRCGSAVPIDALSRIIRGATTLSDIEKEDEYSGSDHEKVLRCFKVCVRDILKIMSRINRVELERAVKLAFPDVRKDIGHLWAKQVHSAVVSFRLKCKTATSGKKLSPELQEILPLLRTSAAVAKTGRRLLRIASSPKKDKKKGKEAGKEAKPNLVGVPAAHAMGAKEDEKGKEAGKEKKGKKEKEKKEKGKKDEKGKKENVRKRAFPYALRSGPVAC